MDMENAKQLNYSEQYVTNILDSFVRDRDETPISTPEQRIITKPKIKPIILAENTAIETLREYITEYEFRKYLIRGFLNVQAASGLVYQIRRNNNHVKVFQRGVKVEELCVHFRDCNVPPSDKIIAFKIMIETDEQEFRNMANVYNMRIAA